MTDYESLKEQIRQRVDLVGLVSEHVALRRAGRDFTGLCPFHHEKTPSFSVSPSKGIFKCFGCGAGGDVFTFLQMREGVTFPEAMRILADRAGLDYQRLSRRGNVSQGGPDRSDLSRVNEWAASQYRSCLADEQTGAEARKYLSERGLKPETIEQFGLGLAIDDSNWLLNRARTAGISEPLLLAAGLIQSSERGDNYGVFRGRLMFPIRDTMNRVIGFGGRTLKGDKAKYLNTSQNALFDKGRNVYGADVARPSMAETRRVVVVEGYTDCMAAHQYGYSNTVATLGTALTDSHVEFLRRWCDEVVLLFDSDQAGLNAADRAVGVALRYNISVKIAHVPSGKDPCDYLTSGEGSGFEEVLKSATDALVFKWKRTRDRYQTETRGSDRKEAIREFVGLVAEMARFRAVDSIQRGLIVNQLAGLLALPSAEVHGLLERAARRVGASGGSPVPGPTSEVSDGMPRSSTGDRDAEQAALLTMLEVLVSEPGYCGDVLDVFRPERFTDVRDRRIAQRLLALYERLGDFPVSHLLGEFEDPEDARYLTDLLYRGTKRGNYDATLSGSRTRLEEIERVRRAKQAAERLRGQAVGEDATDEDELLRSFTRERSESHGFGGRSVSSSWGRLPGN